MAGIIFNVEENMLIIKIRLLINAWAVTDKMEKHIKLARKMHKIDYKNDFKGLSQYNLNSKIRAYKYRIQSNICAIREFHRITDEIKQFIKKNILTAFKISVFKGYIETIGELDKCYKLHNDYLCFIRDRLSERYEMVKYSKILIKLSKSDGIKP